MKKYFKFILLLIPAILITISYINLFFKPSYIYELKFSFENQVDKDFYINFSKFITIDSNNEYLFSYAIPKSASIYFTSYNEVNNSILIEKIIKDIDKDNIKPINKCDYSDDICYEDFYQKYKNYILRKKLSTILDKSKYSINFTVSKPKIKYYLIDFLMLYTALLLIFSSPLGGQKKV